jgi:predicted nucleic acid-binding protein
VVILADTSAWIEFLRATGSEDNVRVRRALDDDELVTTDPVVMELLAGEGTEERRDRLRRLLAGCPHVAVAPADWEQAAELYRACRAAGQTVRKMTDCLIAAVAIRERLAVVHHDRDFDVLARHTPLEVA